MKTEEPFGNGPAPLVEHQSIHCLEKFQFSLFFFGFRNNTDT